MTQQQEIILKAHIVLSNRMVEGDYIYMSSRSVVLYSCFTTLRHFSGHFGRSQLIYPHWASLLGSLPVFSACSFFLESAEGRE